VWAASEVFISKTSGALPTVALNAVIDRSTAISVMKLAPTDFGKGHAGFTGGGEQAQLDGTHAVEQRLVDVKLVLFCVLHQVSSKE
jgi:hypothetical protein